MPRKRASVAALALATLAGLALPASAGGPTAEQGGAEDRFFGYSAGVVGAVGGNYLTPPEDVPAGYGELAFADGAGGLGGGGGIAGEIRILWGHLGLEVDLIFERSKNWASITYGDVVETDWIVRSTSLRIPILLEGSLENELLRASLGVGPEIAVGLGAETDVETTSGAEYVSAGDLAAIRDRFGAASATDTLLTVGLGFAVKVWVLAIRFDFRYAYNLTQPDGYLDRVDRSEEHRLNSSHYS